MFHYRAELILSKSWLNRALIIQSYGTATPLNLVSNSEDVLVLKKALQDLQQSKTEFHLGQGGTSLRFFCVLVSRRPGNWVIHAHPRLLARPQQGLQDLLKPFGVDVSFHSDHIRIISQGWDVPPKVVAKAQESSQFFSAFLLNAWSLSKDLTLEIQKPIISLDYLEMTLKMLAVSGMHLQITETEQIKKIFISKNQQPTFSELKPEVDVSSAFSLAAAAVIDGVVEIQNWNVNSIQPDIVFLKIFDQMGIAYSQGPKNLKITKQASWRSVDVNLNASPDLFPVLAVLCALADGRSHLSGAKHLRHKESDRLQKTKELLDLAGFRSELKEDGMVIFGLSSTQNKQNKIIFDPDHDHRMAMAAGLLKLAGYSISIQNPEVIQKSYASFWKDIGVQP